MARPLAPFLVVAVLAASGCAGSIESALESADESGTVPSGLVVSYDDRAPLLGGDRLEIAADGTVRWWSDVPAPIDAGVSPEDAFDDVRRMPELPSRTPDREGRVDADGMRALLDLLIAIAPWDSSPDDADDSRLERRRAFLTLTRGGTRESSWQWADPTESGDERITAIRRWAEIHVPRPAPPVVEETSGDEATGPNPVLRNP